MDILAFLQWSSNIIYQYYETVGMFVYNFYRDYSKFILDLLHAFFYNGFYVLLFLTISLTTLFAVIAFYVLFKKAEKEKPVTDDELPSVTIQIPTYNELAALNCAKKCLELDYPKEKYEIIIGDDSSDEGISKKIDAFASKHRDKIIVTRRGSNTGYKPGNLNYMLKFSRGDYIVIFDSDFLPKRDFLRRIIAPFVHQKDISAVQARWLIKNFSQNFYSMVGGIIPMFSHQVALPFLKSIGSNSFIAGSAEAVKKKDLIELGGWKEGSLTEDIDFSLRLTKLNKKILYLENLYCECEAPFTLKDLSQQQMRWSYGVITAFKEHFWSIIRNKKVPFVKSINMFLLVFGYLVTVLFFLLALFGSFSIVTGTPEPINFGKLFSEIARNFFWTSGFIVASILTLAMSNRLKETPKMIIASLTIGMVIVYKVSIGVFKAIFNRPMVWFMLQKTGNRIRE